MSVPPHNLHGMYHPWRTFEALTHITLRWASLPRGIKAITDFDANEVILDPEQNKSQADRRCSLAHELQHLIRGPVMPHLRQREEVEVEKIAARLLLPDIKAVAKALEWSGMDLEEAAEELWVDEPMLRCRLNNLHPAERGYLKARLAEL